MTTINVAEARVNGEWCNIKTPEGKEISVKLDKCPKLKADIDSKNTPYQLTGILVEKNGKNYLWDPEEKKSGFGGGKPSKGNESFALSYAKDIYVALAPTTKAITTDQMFKLADSCFDWLESKKK